MHACEMVVKLLAGLVGVIIFTINIRAPAYSQTAMASLSGTVVDETRAVVPSVRITVINNRTSFQRQATTNDEGYFIIPLLPPGTYTLTAETPGFTTVAVNDLLLQVSTNTAVNIVLLPEEIAESIEVLSASRIGADGNRIDITDATTRYTITNKQVERLPVLTTLFGRNTLGALAFAAPGVTLSSQPGSRVISSQQLATNPISGFDLGLLQASRLGNQISINGSRPHSISFSLDGGDNNDHELSQAASPLPNPDALQELAIITGSYQADLGRSSGGIINGVVRSGTGSYRGNLRHILINESLNARSFFSRERPRERLNTFGGQLGGPLPSARLFKGKSRAFFFLDYEGTRLSQEFQTTVSVPTAQERAGDFSHLPTALQPADPRIGVAFDGGIIPADRIDPISRIYLERFIPVPDEGERKLRQRLSTRFLNDQITLRLDRKVGPDGALGLTYFHNLSDVNEGRAALPLGSRTNTRVKSRNLVLRATHVLSAQTVNQFTGALTRLITSRQSVAPGLNGVPPSHLGFSGIRSGEFLSAPAVSILGTAEPILVGGVEAALHAKTTWQIKDDLSHSVSKHAFKFGAEARGFLQNSSTAGDNGSFTFAHAFNESGTGNSFADFLLGIPSEYVQSSGSARYPRQIAYYAYVMDDWRIRDNLTINMGLRYDLAPPLKDKRDQAILFRPGHRSERFPNAPEGLLFAGDPDPLFGRAPRGTYLTDKNNLAPRLAVAYSPRPKTGWARRLLGQGKTAIRLAWGVFYDQTYGLSFTRLSSAEPFSVAQHLSASQIRAAGGTFAGPFGDLPNPFPPGPGQVVFSSRPNLQPFDPAFRTAYAYHYNLTLQRELPWSLLMEIGYVGNNRFKLGRERELNPAAVGRGATLSNTEDRRVHSQFGKILSQESTGRARYDSFQARLARRLATGLTLDGSYVFSKSLDNSSSPLSGMAPDPLRWARSTFNRTHSVVVSYSYSFADPSPAGPLKHLLGGWQVAGITEFRSGLPLEILQLEDTTLTGANMFGTPDLVGPFVRLDPRKQQTIVVDGVPRTGNFFFDPRSFRRVTVTSPGEARPGNLGRNVFDGPVINLWSLSAAKRFRLTGSQDLVLRSDIGNLFNRPNFQLSPANLNVGWRDFGQVSSAAPGRTVQLSLRYHF